MRLTAAGGPAGLGTHKGRPYGLAGEGAHKGRPYGVVALFSLIKEIEMSETRFTLRRPGSEGAGDVESYIEHGPDGGPAAEEEERLRRLVVLLPEGTHRRFKQLAAERGVTMSELCRGWVEEALAAHFG